MRKKRCSDAQIALVSTCLKDPSQERCLSSLWLQAILFFWGASGLRELCFHDHAHDLCQLKGMFLIRLCFLAADCIMHLVHLHIGLMQAQCFLVCTSIIRIAYWSHACSGAISDMPHPLAARSCIRMVFALAFLLQERGKMKMYIKLPREHCASEIFF